MITGAIGYQVVLGGGVAGAAGEHLYQQRGHGLHRGADPADHERGPGGAVSGLSRRIRIALAEYKVWRLFALISLALFAGYFVTGASTALDRVALYMIPLQLFVFAHLPDLMGRYHRLNQPIVLLIVLYSALIQFVWLMFGNFSRAWLPYGMWLG